MRDWIYGFFMAWGMFLAIPCPKKIWSETARRKMLACLPFVGIVVGAVWALCAWLAWYLPHPLGAALCAAAPWLVTGFLHLDGFMAQWSAFLSVENVPLLPLALVPVASRAAAAVAVLTLRPMSTSQYSAMVRGGAPLYVAAAVLAAACAVPAVLWGSFAPLAAAVGYGLAVWHGFRQFDGMSGDISGFGLVVAELCGAVVLAIGG